MRLDEAREHIGDTVVYHCAGRPPEDGVITEVRGDYVFVLYTGDRIAKATHPMSLELAYAR